MRIIILNGSPRKNGATAKILHTIESELCALSNVEVKYVDIGNLKVNFCTGCCSCYKVGHCYMNDDAEIISKEIESADGLIVGTPTYASNISGQLKTFIDRGHFVIEQLLHEKYAISVVTGENYGSVDTSKILNKLLRYSGARLSGKIIYNLPFNSNPLNDKKLKTHIHNLSTGIYHDIKLRKRYFLQGMIHKIIFNIGIKPFVLKKGETYKGVLTRWKYQRIYSEK